MTQQDWQEILPHDVQPSVMNPRAGLLYSGNHRPVEAWYPIPLGAMTGTGGDTVRSWRLHERLAAKPQFAPEDVRAVHSDDVNPARRDIVRLGLHLREQQEEAMSRESLRSLQILEPWHRDGASMSLRAEGSALAMELNTFFRFVRTELAFKYGGGESGLTYFLKSATHRIDRDSRARLSDRESGFIDQSLATAWRACRKKYGEDSSSWQRQACAAVTRRRLGYYESLDRFPGLDVRQSIALPPLDVIDGGTIACQTSQSYTQWVPLHEPDLAESLLPIGQTERPDSEFRMSTLTLWSEGRLHPAPLSKERIDDLSVTRLVVEMP